MAVPVNLKKGDVRKQGVVGFSWTTFFFGCFVPLFRGDIKWCLIMLVLAVFTGALSNIAFAFFYNKHYTQELLTSGFEPETESDRTVLKGAGLLF